MYMSQGTTPGACLQHTQRLFWFFFSLLGMGKGISVAFVALVMAVLAQVTSMILTKEAMSIGLSEYTLVVYSNALSTLILTPSSFIFHRLERPPLSFYIVFSFFLLGFIGFVKKTLFLFSKRFKLWLMGLAGLNYASATLNTTMLNLIPAFTFILALLFRMEKLNWRSSSSQAKSFGAVVSITGAFVVTFYKGPAVIHQRLSSDPLSGPCLFSPKSHWVLGGSLLAAEAFMSSLWIILQALILKKYPAVLILASFYCFFVTIQAALASLILVKDPSAWSLKPNIGLFAVLYSAVVGTALRTSAVAWCLQRTGPLYVSMFKPLAVVVADVIDVIFLGQALHLGSLVGAAVIITGFYAVIWGKAREEKLHEDSGEGQWSESSSESTPLLQSAK
ncbi:WAT1-related protein At5g40240 isoform X1 [Prunus persica]|uniref:WAT1-related protein At5g40240 isoform X1 n=1 Tax=Prunus persica TaxID=3760 RepID=UPI0009AB7354|nr:WAT1-related protein At5g40240 isoform X1 [Prunus persica]